MNVSGGVVSGGLAWSTAIPIVSATLPTLSADAKRTLPGASIVTTLPSVPSTAFWLGSVVCQTCPTPDRVSVALYVTVTGPFGFAHDTGTHVMVASGGELSDCAAYATGCNAGRPAAFVIPTDAGDVGVFESAPNVIFSDSGDSSVADQIAASKLMKVAVLPSADSGSTACASIVMSPPVRGLNQRVGIDGHLTSVRGCAYALCASRNEIDTTGGVVSICTGTSSTVSFPAASVALNVKSVVWVIEIAPRGVCGSGFVPVVYVSVVAFASVTVALTETGEKVSHPAQEPSLHVTPIAGAVLSTVTSCVSDVVEFPAASLTTARILYAPSSGRPLRDVDAAPSWIGSYVASWKAVKVSPPSLEYCQVTLVTPTASETPSFPIVLLEITAPCGGLEKSPIAGGVVSGAGPPVVASGAS